MYYYPHHIGDFRSGTVNMSRVSRWIYRDMLDVYYDTEQALPLDLDLLCDMLGVESDEERRVTERLLRFKFVKGEDGYHNSRCDSEIAAYRARSETAKENGKKSAVSRYQIGENMLAEGVLYAIRINEGAVKIGASANLRSRLHQLRGKFGVHAQVLHQVPVAHMGRAEADLLAAYEAARGNDLLPMPADGEADLIACMDRIRIAYPVASMSHSQSLGDSHSDSHADRQLTKNQEPRTNNQTTKDNTSGQSPDGDVSAVKAKAPRSKNLHGTEEDLNAVRWMHTRIKIIDPTAKEPTWNAWANEMRLMREVDNRTHRDACELFAWANRDSFWGKNILSPGKLREKWQQLVLARQHAAAMAAPRPAAAPANRYASAAAAIYGDDDDMPAVTPIHTEGVIDVEARRVH